MVFCKGVTLWGGGARGVYVAHGLYVLVIVDCFSRWNEACPLPNKMALAIADVFFQLIICWFGMPVVTTLIRAASSSYAGTVSPVGSS